MEKYNLRGTFRKNFSESVRSYPPSRLILMASCLNPIADFLFSEMDKTFNGDPNPGVAAFYWVRQAHCFLSRYQEALHSARKELNGGRKDPLQFLTSIRIDEHVKNHHLHSLRSFDGGMN